METLDAFDIRVYWKRMTLAQKREWWEDTDYGNRRPSDEIKAKVREWFK